MFYLVRIINIYIYHLDNCYNNLNILMWKNRYIKNYMSQYHLSLNILSMIIHSIVYFNNQLMETYQANYKLYSNLEWM